MVSIETPLRDLQNFIAQLWVMIVVFLVIIGFIFFRYHRRQRRFEEAVQLERAAKSFPGLVSLLKSATTSANASYVLRALADIFDMLHPERCYWVSCIDEQRDGFVQAGGPDALLITLEKFGTDTQVFRLIVRIMPCLISVGRTFNVNRARALVSRIPNVDRFDLLGFNVVVCSMERQ